MLKLELKNNKDKDIYTKHWVFSLSILGGFVDVWHKNS